MRKGNKTKLIVALLSAALTVNAFAFAPMAAPEVEMEVEFVEVPDETVVDIQVPDALQPDEVDELDFAELQAAGSNRVITTGSIIDYDGSKYMVVGNNFVSKNGADGTFEVNPDNGLSGNERTDNIVWSGISHSWITDPAIAHNGNGCIALYGNGAMIWRHSFSSEKLYVYSAWFKFENAEAKTNINNGQRHISGAIDVATGEAHRNPIGESGGTEIVYGTWQQDMCVFRGAGSGEDKFLYFEPTNAMDEARVFVDDFVVYEVVDLGSLPAYEAISLDGSVPFGMINRNNPFASCETLSPGSYTGIINMVNSSVSSYKVRGIVAIFKNGKLDKIITENATCAGGTITDSLVLVPGVGSVYIDFDFAPDEGVSASEYSFMMYLSSQSNIFEVYGTPSQKNPMVIMGGE